MYVYGSLYDRYDDGDDDTDDEDETTKARPKTRKKLRRKTRMNMRTRSSTSTRTKATTRTRIHKYRHIYIYVCACICVYICKIYGNIHMWIHEYEMHVLIWMYVYMWTYERREEWDIHMCTTTKHAGNYKMWPVAFLSKAVKTCSNRIVTESRYATLIR